jgi:heme-degrading monooxygenase HmoA
MKKQFFNLTLAALLCVQCVASARRGVSAQTRPPQASDSQGSKPQATPQQEPRRPVESRLDLSDYGVHIAPDPRLLVVMAALEAAGWDPTPAGGEVSAFRGVVRRDLAGLDPALRARMKDFYERYRLRDPRATPADQSARYVSLAYTLGPPPGLESPPRSEDLPSAILDVLDFVPLVREFQRQSGMPERLPGYLQMHRAEGDRLRGPAVEMARAVLTYFNTRPETIFFERAEAATATPKGGKQQERRAPVLREQQRRFVIVPDLLAAPGAINFRVVRDDYFAVVPAGTDPRSSEMRRGYIQYVVDPLVARFSREVAAKRAEIKQLLDAERARKGRDVTPDIFLATSRSLVAAADARMDESARLRALQLETSARLQAAGSDASAREAALRDSKARQAAFEDESVARLAEAYERGGVLAFYFAEQLRGLEGSGFDIANFVPDMLTGINAAREQRRPGEYAEAVARHSEARKAAAAARESAGSAAPTDERRAALIKSLSDVDELLRLKNYTDAEARLLALKETHREEPRVYFGLGQAAMLSANDAFDEEVQESRLTSALAHFRQAVLFASTEDRALLSRAHVASGRILAFLERAEEAQREFDAAIGLGEIKDGAYREALAEKKKLAEKK